MTCNDWITYTWYDNINNVVFYFHVYEKNKEKDSMKAVE